MPDQTNAKKRAQEVENIPKYKNRKKQRQLEREKQKAEQAKYNVDYEINKA